MTKQEAARLRNNLKMRLMGATAIFAFNHHARVITIDERTRMYLVQEAIEKLLATWEEQSMELGFEIKPYRCIWCGKRGNVEHIYKDNMNYCAKHFKELNFNDE